ncbi:MAG: glycosyltransferase family 2 protein [Candidatus Acidiferrales bacterium]
MSSRSLPPRVALLMPALDEQQALAQLLDEMPRQRYARLLVVDNGSTDGTAAAARAGGAEVISEPRRGYGRACQTGLAALGSDADIIVFMDADGSDVPAEAERLLEPILRGHADLVIGSRALGRAEPGSMTWPQRWGNRFSVALIRLLFGHRYTDLGPFRAIRRESLERLGMRDTNFGWTAEMQVKAVKRGLRVQEVPVSYRRRVGRSKISGTASGVARAGTKIIWTIVKLRLTNS